MEHVTNDQEFTLTDDVSDGANYSELHGEIVTGSAIHATDSEVTTESAENHDHLMKPT